jgi:crotonobetainyl-CoA:carnitine CoA-transferase CaiB-like acyl-CoA transferase
MPEREVAHRSRPSIVINLQTAAGAKTVLCMAETADVLIEAFRLGVARRPARSATAR